MKMACAGAALLFLGCGASIDGGEIRSKPVARPAPHSGQVRGVMLPERGSLRLAEPPGPPGATCLLAAAYFEKGDTAKKGDLVRFNAEDVSYLRSHDPWAGKGFSWARDDAWYEVLSIEVQGGIRLLRVSTQPREVAPRSK